MYSKQIDSRMWTVNSHIFLSFRYIFWYECDSSLDMISGRIKRADASGANPKTIVENMAYGVRQLVVDSFGQHIYWINRLEHSIHRVNYDHTHGFTMSAIDVSPLLCIMLSQWLELSRIKLGAQNQSLICQKQSWILFRKIFILFKINIIQ